MQRINAFLPQPVYARLKRFAKKADRPIGELFRDAMIRYLDWAEAQPAQQEAVK